MKNLSKRIISLIMIFAIIITIMPSNIMAKELKENSKKIMRLNPKQEEPIINPRYEYYLKHKDEYKTGYIPVKYIFPEDEKAPSIQRFRSSGPPPYYMTEENLITPVKNQQKTGSCWAHAAISTIETLALKNKLSSREDLDLSEGHMAYNSVMGYDLSTGGNNSVALQYLTRLVGPVSEKNYPGYTIVGYGLKNTNIKLMADIKNKNHEYYIPRVYELDNTIENIKEQVQSEGSVANSYWSSEENGYDPNDSSKYHYVKDGGATNHQVTIVGWDDNIEITNKLGQSYKGAFRVKNSWGNNIGDKGYYWISYDSFVAGKRDPLIVFKGIENKIDNLKNIYTYGDYNIPLGRIGYKGKNQKGINLFDRKEKEAEEITKVTFYNPNVDSVRYKLFVTQDRDLIAIQPGEKNPYMGSDFSFMEVDKDTEKWQQLAEGEFNEKGFYTIDLKTPYKLTDEKFGLRIELENASYLGTTNNNATRGTSFMSPGNIGNKEIYEEFTDSDRYLYLNAITRSVSEPSMSIEVPEGDWQAKEDYDLEKLEPLVLKVVNDGNVRLNNMGFDLLGDDNDKFEIANKDEDLYLPSLDKGKSLEVKIKPKEVLTLEDADKVFKLKLSVEANEIENPVTKDFTFTLKIDQEAREKALDEAKTKAKNELKNLTYLSEDDAKGFNDEIDAIKKPSDTENIISAAKAKNLANAKAKIASEIENLEELDPEEKNGFKNRLKVVADIAEVENIKQEAKNKNDEKEKARLAREKKELEAEKNKLEEAIKKAKNLIKDDTISDTAKDLKIEIDSASNIRKDSTKISEVKKAIESLESKTKAQEDFIKAKETLKTEINQLDDLSKEEKDGFLTQINGAKNQADLEKIKKSAEDTSKNNKEARLALEKAKSDALEKIKAMEYLGEKKEDFIAKVVAAKDKDSLAQVLAEAEKLNSDNEVIALEKEKEKEAEEAVNNLVAAGKNASAEDIETAQKLIDKLKDGSKKSELQDKLNAVVKLVELKAAKEEAIETINALPKIEGEKQGFINRVNEASKVEDVNKVLEEAKKLSQEIMTEEEKLNKTKNEAITSIDSTNMPDLTNEEREGFENKIKSAETIDAVKAIVTEAQNKNDKNKNAKEKLAEKKTQAKATINSLPNIEKEKAGFISEIENAKDLASIESVVQRAQETSSKNTKKIEDLAKAKEEAIASINATNMPDLTNEEREGFENKIKSAETIDVVNNLVKEAKDKNAKNKNAKEELAKAKTEAIKEIDAMENLDEKDKAEFKNQVNVADSIEKVNLAKQAAQDQAANNKESKEETERENEAETALANLEAKDKLTVEEINKAQVLIDNLKAGNKKTDLQNRLNVLKEKEELLAAKADASKKINSLSNIDDLKAAYIERINGAVDKGAVNEIVQEAEAKAKEVTNFKQAKTDAKTKINSLGKLSQDEREELLSELGKITDSGQIASVKALKLKAIKINAKNILKDPALDHLSTEEKNKAIEKIEGADKEETINSIVQAAKNQNAINEAAEKSLKDAREKGKGLLSEEKMKDLTPQEREDFIDEIEKAESPAEINSIVSEASRINKSRDQDNYLSIIRDRAAREIKGLAYLDYSQIQRLNGEISEAMSQEEIDRIIDEAKRLDRLNQRSEEKESWKSSNNSTWNYFPRLENREETFITLPKPIQMPEPKEKAETKKYVYKYVIGKKKFTENQEGVNSEKELDVAPFIENGRTMLPLRAIAESIGIKVDWDNSTRTAIFTNGDLVAKIQIDGNKVVISDGRIIELDAKPRIVKDRIVLPITNVSQIFGLTNGNTADGEDQDIEWDNETQSVIINVKK